MRFGWVRNVCVLDSIHALLQYVLLVSEEEVNSTFFFWSDGIDDSIKRNFAGHYMDLEKNRHYYRTKIVLQCPFLLNPNVRYWGHDHLTFSKYIFRNRKFNLLEDGTLNYVPYPWRKSYTLKKRIRSLWAGPLYCMDVPYAGAESTCQKIFLTGLSDKGEVYTSGKVFVDSFSSLWESADVSKIRFVNGKFNFNDEQFSSLSACKKILLTQPLSEDGFLTEEEKISIYSKIVEYHGVEGLVIKPHPREKTDYRGVFPDVTVFDNPVPMQLITLNGIRFEEAYTLFSSAVFGFPYELKIGYYGSGVSPKLLSLFPHFTFPESVRGQNAVFLDVKGLFF